MRLFLALFLALGLALAQEDVVAQVGPKTITKEAFELRYGLFLKGALAQLGLPDTEETRTLFAQYRAPYLEALAQERALLLRAEAEGLFPKEEDVEARLQELRGAFPSEEAFLEALKGAGLPDLPTYRILLREALALEALEARYRARLRVSPAALRFLYHLAPLGGPPWPAPGTSWCPPWRRPRTSWASLREGRPSPSSPRPTPRTPAPPPKGGPWGARPGGPMCPPLTRSFGP